MIDLPQIEEIDINVDYPIFDVERGQAFQRFLERFNDKIQNEGVTIKLDFKIAYNGELCAYYEDEYDYAFYFEDWYLRRLIQEHGTMMGAIQSFDGEVPHFTFGLKVYPKELAKAILASNTESFDDGEDDNSYLTHSYGNDTHVQYDPHIEIFNLSDYKGKTIKNSNVCLSIVGTEYHDEYDEVQVGVTLTIKPDYGNIYDDNALGYYTDDDTLVGYVPKREQPIVRLFLAEGELEAEVYNINGKFIDTVVQLNKSMVDISQVDGLGFMKVYKKKQYGTYTEERSMCDVYDLIDILNY